MQQESKEGLRPQRYPARPQATVRLGEGPYTLLTSREGIDPCETLEDYIGFNETPGRPLGLSESELERG